MRKQDSIYLLALIGIGLFLVYGLATADEITMNTPVGPYPSSVSTDEMKITWSVAAGSGATETIRATGRELLLMLNTAGTAKDVTLYAQADPMNRDNDITGYSIGAGEYAAFAFTNTVGWRDATGEIVVEAESTDIWFAAIRWPR